MDDTIRVFSGRTISPEGIELIKWARKKNGCRGDTELPRGVVAGSHAQEEIQKPSECS